MISAGNEPTAPLPLVERIWRGVVWLGFGPNAPMGVDEFGHLIAAPYKARPAGDTDDPFGELDMTEDEFDAHVREAIRQRHLDTWAHREAA